MSWRTVVLVFGFAAAGLVGHAAGLRASKPEVRREVVATIEAQLAAFRAKDVAKAFAFSTTALQLERPLPLFTAIVKRNYPEIWANVRAEYGIVRDDGVAATLTVHVFTPKDEASYDYTLVREAGRWRIQGILRHTPVPEEHI